MRPIPPIPTGCRNVVFLGPSFPVEEARLIWPEADFRSPVRMGDLYALIAADIDNVLIIDGVFHGDTPIWQREILSLLIAEKKVYGAASMGALRALELAPYGMVGLGQVFAWYDQGQIEGDDEVALLHADHDLQYMPLTIPMVDVRFGLAQAESQGHLTSSERRTLVSGIKSVGHGSRTLKQIRSLAQDRGISSDFLAAYVGSDGVSLKARDALEAILFLKEQKGLPTPKTSLSPVPAEQTEPILLRAAYAPDGSGLRVCDALEQSFADQAGTARRRREESRRFFLADWMKMTEFGPSAAEIEAFADVWIQARAEGSGLSRSAWLRASGILEKEVPELMKTRAFEAWLGQQAPQALDLPSAPEGIRMIPRIIAKWATLMGVQPPADLAGDVESIAAWVVQNSPAHFGLPDWNEATAMARALMLDGGLAKMTCGISEDLDARSVS